MTTGSQNLPIRQTKIRPPGLLRQDTKLAGLIKKPSLRLCGRRHQVSANARIEEKPCQEHKTSQKQNPLRSPRLNFFVLIRVNSWLNTINDIRYTFYSLLLSLYICRESSTNSPLFMQNKANFRKSQMNISSAITMNYEQLTTNYANKNKPNSKPTCRGVLSGVALAKTEASGEAGSNPISNPSFKGLTQVIEISGLRDQIFLDLFTQSR